MNPIDRNKWKNDVKYDVVQFDLVNPTSVPISIDLFETNTLTNIATQPIPFTPVVNQFQQSVSGTSPTLQGMGYIASANYLFISADTGERIVWDISNSIQISQYTISANPIVGNIIERPSDGKVWGMVSGTARLVEIDYTSMTEIIHSVTTLITVSGVHYDVVTDTVYFGYLGSFTMGSFHLGTNTLVDITTSGTVNNSVTINPSARRVYGAGSVVLPIITEIDLDTKLVLSAVDFSSSGITAITEIVVDVNTGAIWGTATDGITNYVGEFDLVNATFTPYISGLATVFGGFINLVIANNTLFIYDTESLVDTISTIDVLTKFVTNNKVTVGGTVAIGTTAQMVVAPDQFIFATKGTGGAVKGDLTVFPTTQAFYINGSVNYNFFVKSIFTAPKRVYGIEFNTAQQNLLNEWVIITKDANGNECQIPYLPNIYLSKDQVDSNQSWITFNDGYIMDITSDVRYVVPANSTVILLLWYKEIKRSEKLLRTKDFSNDSGAFAKEVVNQEEKTGLELDAMSGLNIFNYWLPKTMMVDHLVDNGEYPIAWKDMESLIPREMIIKK